MERDRNDNAEPPETPAIDVAARELDEDKIEALRLIDEAPFSCVATLFCLLFYFQSPLLTATTAGFMLRSA